MVIDYFGHSCFFIQGKDKSVLTDPFDGIGYPLPRVSAEFVTVSHDHFDHNHLAGVNIEKVAVTDFKGDFSGIECDHDPEGGALRGKSKCFYFVVDGVSFLHMGDIGEPFNKVIAERLKKFINIDILFIPVGSVYTIDCAEAVKYIEYLKPSIAIPMHFKTKRCKLNIESADGFLKKIGNYKSVGSRFVLEKQNLIQDKPIETETVYMNID